MKERLLTTTVVVALVVGAACTVPAAEIAPADVVLKTELEAWGRATGLSATAHPQASGGIAMAMASDAMAVGALEMAAGDYTLVLWQYAPAGDADGFFVEVDGRRTRLLGTIGRWGTLVLPFTVERTGPVTLAIIGQEAGMTVDRIAVVRGTHNRGQIEFDDIPGDTSQGRIGLDDIVRLAIPCGLAEAPTAPLPPDGNTVYAQDFEAEPEGVVGDHRRVTGPFGQALVLDMPDGRFDVPAAGLEIADQGTVEWWVKTREAARVWSDQGRHYFVHLAPAQPGGTQLDLEMDRNSMSLIITPDGAPYELTAGTGEAVHVNVGNLSNTDWHHLLISWDLRGDRQHIWFLVDGRGMERFFPRTFEPAGFARIEFGNTPSAWDVPYQPMDGAIDAIRISNISVAERLAQ